MVMLLVGLMMVFVGAMAVVTLMLSFTPLAKEDRPTLKFQSLGIAAPVRAPAMPKKKFNIVTALGAMASVFKVLVNPEMRRRLIRDLGVAQSSMTPELFMCVKVGLTIGLLFTIPPILPVDLKMFGLFAAVAAGWVGPEMYLRSKIQNVKAELVKNLPDTVDLLGLCVNAGLDFMMALKWVVDKSSKSVIIMEMNNILQEISVGKPRREALRDLSRKYEIPDLSTFTRTLIQADKMGTSVSEALNILSEDMRLARYRRGEAVAMKAPLKMLVPLLLFIFPTVFILVGAPIFLDFVLNNPLKNIAGGN